MAAAAKTRQAMPSPQGSRTATSTTSSGIAAMRESVRRFGRSVGIGMGPVLLDHHRVNRGQLVPSLLINRNIFSNADGAMLMGIMQSHGRADPQNCASRRNLVAE